MNNELVDIFKSLSDQTRLSIIKLLVSNREMSCQELSEHFNLSQPTLSHHFKKLVDAQVINEKKDGVWRRYSINSSFLRQKGIDLKKIFHT